MKKLAVILVIFGLLFLYCAAAEEESGEASGVHFMFGSITVIFGIIALVWTFSARKNIAEGSSLRMYITNFLIALLFITGASFWHFIREVTPMSSMMGEMAEYPEYLLLIIAYLVFVLAAYQMKFISKEFSFEDQKEEIKKALDNKK